MINGRNVWRADLTDWFDRLQPLIGQRQQLWIGSSCSLLHSPIDLSVETRLDDEVKSWFAFALQKCAELALLSKALNQHDAASLHERANSRPGKLSSCAQRRRGAASGANSGQRHRA